jgi:O-glycosyl hydrolase
MTYRHIPEAMYPEFAEFIVSFLLHARSVYGVNIRFIEIQNEPNIGWRVYHSPEGLADITEVVIELLEQHGLDQVKLHIGNVNKPTAAIAYWEPSLDRPGIAVRTAAAAYHPWEDMTQGVVEALKVFCHNRGVQCWATEVGSGSLDSHTWDYGRACMRKYHQVFLWSDSSLAFQWTLAGPQGSISPGGDPYPVYFLIKHYFQHIEPGSIRVDTYDCSGTKSTAFLNKADCTLAIVTINESYARHGKFIIHAPDIEFKKFTVYRSQLYGMKYQNVGKVPVSDNTFSYDLDPDAYYTFVGHYGEYFKESLPLDRKIKEIPVSPGKPPAP